MKYVAFLRAINVGGHAIIKMADLKKTFEAAGLDNVQTYIQSGNVIFQSDESETSITQRIEGQLEEVTEYKIHTFVRTIRQVRSIAERPPFTAEAGQSLFVVFLKNKPNRMAQQSMLSYRSPADDFAFNARELYILRRDREKSVFSGNLIEKTLNMPVTTRNLTTITKIVGKYG